MFAFLFLTAVSRNPLYASIRLSYALLIIGLTPLRFDWIPQCYHVDNMYSICIAYMLLVFLRANIQKGPETNGSRTLVFLLPSSVTEQIVSDDDRKDSEGDREDYLRYGDRRLACDLTCLTVDYEVVDLAVELVVCDPDGR